MQALAPQPAFLCGLPCVPVRRYRSSFAEDASEIRMFLPDTYHAALFLMVLSMLCWGSWANTLKLCPRFRFQLFYWDYALGLAAGAVAWGLTAGSLGHAGAPLLAAVERPPGSTMPWA